MPAGARYPGRPRPRRPLRRGGRDRCGPGLPGPGGGPGLPSANEDRAAEWRGRVNLAPRVRHAEAERVAGKSNTATVSGLPPAAAFTEDHLALIRWPRVLAQLSAYAWAKGYLTLHLDPEVLRQVLAKHYYTLYAPKKALEDLEAVESAVLAVLRSYLDNFYRPKVLEEQTKTLTLSQLREEELPASCTVTLPEAHYLLSAISREGILPSGT